MSNLEIVAVRCPECELMVGAGENHACWSQELGMRAFEAAMWKKWKQEEGNPIELEDDEYEAWIANETRHCHENGLPFPVSGEAMIEEMRDLEALVPSEQERLSLLEPTPYDSGTCACGQHVEAGKLHEHQCSQLIEELGPEAEQAMRASEDERIESRTWEWEERRYEAERIAYCGWEEF